MSHSNDPAKNPLTYQQKIYFARKLFGSRFPQLRIEDAPYATLIEVMQSLQDYDEVILLAGSDRVPAFQQLLDKYNGQPDKAGNILYSFTSIRVVSAGERDPDAEDVTGMSASKMRALAKEDNFDGFRRGVPTEDDALAQELFTAVRRGMKLIEARLLEVGKISKAQQAKLKNLNQRKAAAAAKSPGAAPAEDPNAAKKAAAAEFKKVTDKNQEEDDKKGQDAVSSFTERAKSLPADGGLSKSTEDYSKARAQVLFLLADPVTKYHAAVIDQFVKAPVRVSRDTRIPQGTQAYRIIAIASSKNDIIDNAGVRALWVRDLVGSTKNALVMFGKVEAIARTLASRFGYLEFTAQGRVFNKTSSLIVAEWNRAKGAQTTAFALQLANLGVTTTTFDDPNSAQEALSTVDKQLITDIGAFKKQVEDGTSIATELEKQIAAIADKRKKAFIEELPRGKNLAYLEAIYYAFCALYKKKTGKSFWDLFKSVFASEITAVSELGQELGVTQAVQAAGKVKSFLSSGTQEQPTPNTSTTGEGA